MATTIQELQAKITADIADYEKGLKTVDDHAQKSTGLFGKLTSGVGGFVTAGLAVAGVGVGIGAVTDYLKGAVQGAMDMQVAQAETNRVLSSGSHVAGLTASAIDNLSASLMKQTGVDDDVIHGAENVLAGFRNISKADFSQVTSQTLDLARAMGTDASSAAEQYGRALNDPANASRFLRQAHISLTDAEQKAMDKAKSHNNIAKEQAILMQAVKEKVGGSAEAYRNTAAGGMMAFQTAMGNIQKTIGAALMPILAKLMEKLLPLAQVLADNLPIAIAFVSGAISRLTPILKFLADNGDMVKTVLAGLALGIAVVSVPILVGLVPAFIAWAAGAAAAAIATIAATWPILAIIAAIVLLVVGIKLLIDHWKQITDFLGSAWKIAVDVVTGAMHKLLSDIGNFAAGVIKFFADLPGKVWSIITSFSAGIILRIAILEIQLIAKVASIIHNVVNFFQGLPGQVISAVTSLNARIIGFFADLGGKLFNAGKQIIQRLIDGIRAMAGAVGSAISGVFGNIHLPGFAGGGVAPGGLAMVGENGPEVVALPAGARVYPSGTGPTLGGGGSASASAVSGGQPLHVHIQIAGRDVGDVLMPDIVAELRRSNGTRR